MLPLSRSTPLLLSVLHPEKPEAATARDTIGEGRMQARARFRIFAAAALGACLIARAAAEEIAVSNYGIAANGMPLAAMP